MIIINQEKIMEKWSVQHTENPLVSIKCMTYNQENYISQCLDGFLMQKTTFPFEILVHDDASTDKTAEIVLEYANKFPLIIKPIIETENQFSKHDGSHHKKIDASIKGKYVALCEGDDYWIDENKLQVQVEYLENHLDCMMVFHDAVIKNEIDAENNKSPYGVLETRDYNPTELFEHWTVPTASMVFRKEILNYEIKNIKNILNGDIIFVEKAAHMGSVHCINKQMSVYRIQKSGVTWDKETQKLRLLKYPKHFKEIRSDFPKINKRVINLAIFQSYLNIVTSVPQVSKKVYYLILAFLMNPGVLFIRGYKFLIKKIK